MSDRMEQRGVKSVHERNDDSPALVVPYERKAIGDCNTVWVAGLPRDIEVDAVRVAFAEFGQLSLENGVVLKSNINGTFAFVNFMDQRDGEKAIRKMHNRDLGGCRVTVEHAGHGRKGRGHEHKGGYWNWQYSHTGGCNEKRYEKGCGKGGNQRLGFRGEFHLGGGGADGVTHRGHYRGKGSMGAYLYDSNMSEGLEEARVWIGGLPYDIIEKEIERPCKQYGPLEYIKLKWSETDTYAFVQYGAKEHAHNCISSMDGTQVAGHVIKAGLAMRKSSKGVKGGSTIWEHGNGGKRLLSRSESAEDYGDRRSGRGKCKERSRSPLRRSRHVAEGEAHPGWMMVIENMPNDMEVVELWELVEAFGKIVEIEVGDPQNGCKKGTVVYEKEDAQITAIDELDGRKMEDWHLRLKCYKPVFD